MSMSQFLAVTLGGALGSGCRFLVATAFSRYDAFPFGTLSVNLLGCFAMGALTTYFGQQNEINPAIRMGIIIGFLGGFTTFSSFGLDTMKLIEAQRILAASLYVIGSNVIGLMAIYAGVKCVPAST